MVLAHPVLSVFVAALVVRVAVAVVVLYVLPPDAFSVVDDSTYSGLATAAASGSTRSWDERTWTFYLQTLSYTGPLTALTWLFGPLRILGPLLAAVYGAIAAAAVTWLVRDSFTPRIALLSGAVAALFPSQVLWSSLTLKDSAVWAAGACLAAALVRLSQVHGRREAAWAAASVTLLVLLALLRTSSFVVAVYAAFLAVIVAAEPGRRGRTATGAAAVLLVLPVVVGLGPAATNFVRQQGGSLDTRRAANAVGADTAFRASPAPALSPVQQPTDPVAAQESPLPTPVPTVTAPPTQDQAAVAPASQFAALQRGLVAVVLEPLPWRSYGNVRLDLARFEALLWYPLLLLALIGLGQTVKRRRHLAFPVLYLGGVTLVYALAEGNLGTAYRHRGELVWAVVLLAAHGTTRIRQRRAEPVAGPVGAPTVHVPADEVAST